MSRQTFGFVLTVIGAIILIIGMYLVKQMFELENNLMLHFIAFAAGFFIGIASNEISQIKNPKGLTKKFFELFGVKDEL